jgi:hypothetical protein
MSMHIAHRHDLGFELSNDRQHRLPIAVRCDSEDTKFVAMLTKHLQSGIADGAGGAKDDNVTHGINHR